VGNIRIHSTYRCQLTPDLRVESVPVPLTLDEVLPFMHRAPEPDGVRVRDYGQRADIYYKSWREYRNIHRAAYMGTPIAKLRDVTPAGPRQAVDNVEGAVPLVTGYWSGVVDSLKLPAHNHRIGVAPSLVLIEDDEEGDPNAR
jgi:hypothetical protein